MSNTLPIALTTLFEYISTIISVCKMLTHHYAACWVTLTQPIRNIIMTLKFDVASQSFIKSRGNMKPVNMRTYIMEISNLPNLACDIRLSLN